MSSELRERGEYRPARPAPPGPGPHQQKRSFPVQDLSCFLVDNHGFVLLSKDRGEVRPRPPPPSPPAAGRYGQPRRLRPQVGRFFGEVDGSVMASLIKMGMFRK